MSLAPPERRAVEAYLTQVKSRVLRAWVAGRVDGTVDLEFSISSDGCAPWLRIQRGADAAAALGVLDAFARAMPFGTPPAPIVGDVLSASFTSR